MQTALWGYTFVTGRSTTRKASKKQMVTHVAILVNPPLPRDIGNGRQEYEKLAVYFLRLPSSLVIKLRGLDAIVRIDNLSYTTMSQIR